MTVSTAATTTQRNSQQLANIEANQQAMHSTLHQIIVQLNAVTFNASDAGRGNQAFQAQGFQQGRVQGFQQGQGQGHTPGSGGRRRGFGRGPPQYVGGSFPKFPTPQRKGIPTCSTGRRVSLRIWRSSRWPSKAPSIRTINICSQGGANGEQPGPPPHRSPAGIQGPTQVHQQPLSNVMKRHATWNACYSCSFDVADGHTSMS